MIGEPRLILRGDNREIAKMIYRHLKSSSTEPTEFGTNHPNVKDNALFLGVGGSLLNNVAHGLLINRISIHLCRRLGVRIQAGTDLSPFIR